MAVADIVGTVLQALEGPMKSCKISGAAVLVLLNLSCSEGRFEEGAETSSLFPPEKEDPEVDGMPANLPEEAVEVADEPLETISSEIQKDPLFVECANEPDRPIVADLYQLAPDTALLPDYSQLKAIKKICLAQLDIKVRKFSEGFPGVPNLFEWFSLNTNFVVKVPQDGIWTFKLIADDGANLYINEQKVIDNDGLHPVAERIATADLKAGDFDFRVSYFQGPRFDIALELLWKGPNDIEFTYIPKVNLKRPNQ